MTHDDKAWSGKRRSKKSPLLSLVCVVSATISIREFSIGIVAPIGGGVEAGARLGLGKQEEDDFYTTSDNIQRKRLEVEVQADEAFERTLAREVSPLDCSPYRLPRLRLFYTAAGQVIARLAYRHASCLPKNILQVRKPSCASRLYHSPDDSSFPSHAQMEDVLILYRSLL